MTAFIGRREFITALGGVAAAWPLAAHGQQPKLPTIGYLGVSTASKSSSHSLSLQKKSVRPIGQGGTKDI